MSIMYRLSIGMVLLCVLILLGMLIIAAFQTGVVGPLLLLIATVLVVAYILGSIVDVIIER